MKILYIVPDLYTKGGIQEFARSIYSGLEKKFNLEILNWTNDLNMPTKVVLRRLPSKMGAYVFSKFFSDHFRIKYKTNNVDLLHFWNLEEAMPFLDKKYIVTCHGLELLTENVKGHKKILFQKVLSNAKFITSDSRYTKEIIIKNFSVNRKNIKIISPAIDLKKFLYIKKIKKEKIIIGTLTRFNKRKNVPNIIKALNLIKEKYNIDFIYYLAGKGSEKKRIMRELKKAKFEWKYFEEISEVNKINKFYPSLDVFVMPPLVLPDDVEGFGIVYLEANAYGIPVVASRTGGVSDAVKEGTSGVFADPTSPEDIALKILETLNNKDKYYKSSRNWAKRFDVKRIRNEFAKIYNEIASK